LITAHFSASNRIDLALEDEASLCLLALYTVGAAERLAQAPPSASPILSGEDGSPAGNDQRRGGADAARVTLTQRQKDCLEWLRDGKTYWEIGQILTLSERTVKYHVQEACRALGARTRQQALVEAAIMGLLSTRSVR
jgi:DNA-binding CsgD family transcriptional regulator